MVHSKTYTRGLALRGNEDDLMVFLIESDPTTTEEDLNGTSTNSLGDWVDGTSYPIVDGQAAFELSNTYQVPAYPTVYTICPSGVVNESFGMAQAGTT